MSSLREEIVASEQLRSDLVKWKLIIVSALGAAGLGFTEHSELSSSPDRFPARLFNDNRQGLDTSYNAINNH